VRLTAKAHAVSMSLSDEVWSSLISSEWRRSPRLIRRACPRPLIELASLYRALAEIAADEAQGPSKALVAIDGQAQYENSAPHLPRASDRTWKGFRQRIRAELPNRQFQLYLTDGLQAYAPSVWRRSRDFLWPLLRRVGIPLGGIGIECFSGSYQTTESGIHRDSADNFSFVLEGTKRMMFWPADTFEITDGTGYRSHHKSGIKDAAAYRRTAITIDAEPGDVIYWPHHYWHVATSESLEWTTTINLAMWWETPAALIIRPAIDRVLDALSHQAPPAHEGQITECLDASALPASINAALAETRQALRSSVVDEAVRDSWRRVASSGGFIVPPKPKERQPLEDSDLVQGDPEHPILVASVGRARLNVVSNGYVFDVPASNSVHALLRRVNRGDVVQIGRLLNGLPRTKVGFGQAKARLLLEHLEAVHAINRPE
jgi:50S ribosomal protein L16 3-hydroxylase